MESSIEWPFNSHQCGDLVLPMSQFDSSGCRDEHHLVWMFCNLLLDRVDEDERSSSVVPLVRFGIYPYGKELGTQIAFLSGLEVPIAAVKRIGEVEVVVRNALRCISVCIDHD